jgi:hypothetical protein
MGPPLIALLRFEDGTWTCGWHIFESYRVYSYDRRIDYLHWNVVLSHDWLKKPFSVEFMSLPDLFRIILQSNLDKFIIICASKPGQPLYGSLSTVKMDEHMKERVLKHIFSQMKL